MFSIIQRTEIDAGIIPLRFEDIADAQLERGLVVKEFPANAGGGIGAALLVILLV